MDIFLCANCIPNGMDDVPVTPRGNLIIATRNEERANDPRLGASRRRTWAWSKPSFMAHQYPTSYPKTNSGVASCRIMGPADSLSLAQLTSTRRSKLGGPSSVAMDRARAVSGLRYRWMAWVSGTGGRRDERSAVWQPTQFEWPWVLAGVYVDCGRDIRARRRVIRCHTQTNKSGGTAMWSGR